jgi:AcrR family transcriptional regulator
VNCCLPTQRPRNAAATRSAILDAANIRFAAESYDDVGMRDIARDVGVDAALVNRYFGSKEDLFVAVLDSCDNGGTLMTGDRADWGRRIARELVYERKPESKLRGLLILLRSIGSTKANELVQRSANERFHGPFAQWIGGPDAAIRARLAAGLIMGVAIGREISGGFNMTPEECERMCTRLATTLQGFIDG